MSLEYNSGKKQGRINSCAVPEVFLQICRKLSLFEHILQDEVQSEVSKRLNNPRTPPSSTFKRPRTSEEYPPKQPIPQAANGKTLQYSRTPTLQSPPVTMFKIYLHGSTVQNTSIQIHKMILLIPSRNEE
jgi:hypothetical protein